MEQTMTPKKRIVFDEDPYYCSEGDEIAVDDLMIIDYLTEAEVRESYTDSEIFEHQMAMRDCDYEEEIYALTTYLDGVASTMSDVVSVHGGNPLIVSGSIGRWDGSRSGFSVFKNFDDMMEGPNSLFKDCEIQKVWDENGSLFIHGAHHDGSVTVEVRQLSDAGWEAYSTIDEAYSFETGPFTALGRSYDGSDASVIEALRDLWNATEPPRYMERAFGCPAEEWKEPKKAPEHAMSLKDVSRESREAADALAGERTADALGHVEQTI